jgi:HEAT repeat protein
MRSLESVVADLASTDYDTHLAAVKELPKYGEAAVPHLVALLRASPLDDGEMEDILRGLRSLARHADAAIPDLVVALRGPLRFARYEAEYAILEFGEPAARALVAELDADTERARTAASVLGRFEDLPEIVIPALVGALSHADEYVRYSATYGLQRFEDRATAAIPRLIDLLDDETSNWTASDCLAAIGPAAVPALADALESGSPRRRNFAARALAHIGRSASASIPALRRLLEGALSGGRGNATEALGAVLLASEAVPLLVGMLEDADEGMRGIAADCLGRLGAQAETAAPALRSAMFAGAWYGRIRAAHALLLVSDHASEAVAVISGALGSADDWMDGTEAARRLRQYVARGGEGAALVEAKAALKAFEDASLGK